MKGYGLAAGANGRRDRPQLVGDEHEDGVGRRLLEVLEQSVGGLSVHRLGREDEIDAPRCLERAHVQVAPECPDIIDADLIADGLEHEQIGMRALLDAAQVAEQLGREEKRRASLTDPGRAVEEIGVSHSLRQRRP